MPCKSQVVDQPYAKFRSKLISIFSDSHIEDGVTHPSEDFLIETLKSDVPNCRRWVSRFFTEQYKDSPSLCADIVRCVGRLDNDCFPGLIFRISDDALLHKDVEVREAAVLSLEYVGGPSSLDRLRRHNDSAVWLDEYVQRVIIDLSKQGLNTQMFSVCERKNMKNVDTTKFNYDSNVLGFKGISNAFAKYISG